MKKIGLVLLAVLLLLGLTTAIVLPKLGLSATDLKANLQVATGMGAKLGCSARYVSGMTPHMIASDLASYSAATDLLSVDFDDASSKVEVSLVGLAPAMARYRQGLGCTLEIGDTSPLDQLIIPEVLTNSGWLSQDNSITLQAPVQSLLQDMLRMDNGAGLQTRALLVLHKGQLAGEAYAPDFDADSMLLGWSMGKSLTAMMLGHLEMLGEVSIQERRLFSEWLEDDRAEISLENMLHMTSGLDFSEVYAPGSDATAMLFTTHSASDVAMASGLSHDPGQHFYYSSGTTNLLARLINDRLGGTQAAVNYLADSFLRPLGLRRMLLEVDPSGIFVSSSYVYASARDWASLGQLMLNEGTWGAQRLLTEDWVSRAQTPNNSTNDPAYGYQFWLNRGGPQLRWPALPVDAYAMRGNREQTVMIVPSANVVIVRLGWTAGTYPMAQRFAAILGALNHG